MVDGYTHLFDFTAEFATLVWKNQVVLAIQNVLLIFGYFQRTRKYKMNICTIYTQ